MNINKYGFTLVEVLVATVIVIALAIGVFGLQYALGQSQQIVWKTYINVDQTNSDIQEITRQLRTASFGGNGAYPLEAVNEQQIVFYSDIDFDNQIEKVSYFLEGTTLYKSIIEPSGYPVQYPEENKKQKVISSFVRNGSTPVFYYYNGNWPEDQTSNPLLSPISPSEVKLIQFYLRLNSDPAQPEKDYIFQSFVQPRMLKENL